MIRAPRLPIFLAFSVALLAGAIPGHHARAQERPRYGGELVFLVPSEPPSYDGHREGTFGTVHPLAPLYNTLLRIDPADRTGTRPSPDLAESWTISADGLTYTFRLRQGVRFHDGSLLTSRDVKASYDKIVFPPPGIISARKGAYQVVEAVEAPDPLTVRFRLKWPEASFLVNLSSPFNWIYKADILAKDIRWYETNSMGTGPFKFVEHVKGSHWVAKKNQTTGTRESRISTGTGSYSSPPRRPRSRPFAESARTPSSAASLPRSATASSRPSARRSPCRKARGTASRSWPSITSASPSTTSASAARSPWPSTATRPPGTCPRSPWFAKSRASRCRAPPGPRPPRSWKSSPATGVISRRRGRRRAGSSVTPGCPRASRSLSRTAEFPCRTRRWGYG